MFTHWRGTLLKEYYALTLLLSTSAAIGVLGWVMCISIRQSWAMSAIVPALLSTPEIPLLVHTIPDRTALPAVVGTPPPADLVITQTDSADVVRPDVVYSYTVAVVNNGPGAASFVELTDILPPAATLTDIAPTQGSCHAQREISCQLGVLDVHTAVTVTLVVQPGAQGIFTNVASVTADESDPDMTNNVMTETTKVTAIRYLSGFQAQSLPVSPDLIDGSELVTIGFGLQLFGVSYTRLYVSENGNVTFNRPYQDVPIWGLDKAIRVILAPFASDVDMRAPNARAVTYGWDSIHNRPAFGVNWVDVGYYDGAEGADDKRNRFQLVLIDRSDVVSGAFDIEFNYEQIQWEAGNDQAGSGGLGGQAARAGYSNRDGTPEYAFELAGSGVPGSFLDSSPTGLIHRNLGTQIFHVRNGVVLPDLVVTKQASADPVHIDETLTYTVRVENTGGGHAPGAILTDTLPNNLVFNRATSSQGSCAQPNKDRQIVCNLNMVAAQDVIEATIVVTAPDTPQEIINRARVTSKRPDLQVADNETTLRTQAGRTVRLLLDKQATPEPVVAGQVLTYAITVTNDDSTTARGVSVVETLSPDVTYLSGSIGNGNPCSANANGISCPIGSLLGQSTMPVTITVLVDREARGTINSMATIQSFDVNIASLELRTATVTTTVEVMPDLELLTFDNPDPVVAGTGLNYRLRVVNASEMPATDVLLVDTLPVEASYVMASSEQGPCSEQGGTITCTLGTISERPVFVDITATVTPLAQGIMTNTAQVWSAERDVDLATNTDIITTAIAGLVNLSVSNSADIDIAQKNRPFSYTITIFNAGPSAASSVVFTDELDTALHFNFAQPDQGSCSAVDERFVSCALGELDVAETMTITLAVTPVERGFLTSTVMVAAKALDTDTSDNQNSLGIEVRGEADLSVTTVALPNPAVAGAPLVYRATVKNAGPDEGFEVAFEEDLPGQVVAMETLTETVTASQGSCTISNRKVQCALANLTVGAEATVLITTTVNPDVRRTIRSTARVSGKEFDFNTKNDTARVDTSIIGQADVGVTAPAMPEQVLAGTALNYTLVITNAGPSEATRVVVTDTLMTGVNSGTVVASQGTCKVEALTLSGRLVSCDLGDVAAHDVVTISVISKVEETTIASIRHGLGVHGVEDDPQPANNERSQGIRVNTQADLRVRMVNSPTDSIVAGEVLISSITVDNLGPSVASNVMITETLPAGLAFISASPGCAAFEDEIACTVGNLSTRDRATITVTGRVDPLLRTALTTSVQVGSAVTDPVAANNGADTSTAVAAAADLVVRTTTGTLDEQVTAGGKLIYTIAVTNDGPSTATGLVLTDTLPSDVQFVQSAISTGGDCETPVQDEVICALGQLAPAASATLTVEVRIDGNVDIGDSLINITEIRGNEPDPNLNNGNQTMVTVSIGSTEREIFLPFLQR